MFAVLRGVSECRYRAKCQHCQLYSYLLTKTPRQFAAMGIFQIPQNTANTANTASALHPRGKIWMVESTVNASSCRDASSGLDIIKSRQSSTGGSPCERPSAGTLRGQRALNLGHYAVLPAPKCGIKGSMEPQVMAPAKTGQV